MSVSVLQPSQMTILRTDSENAADLPRAHMASLDGRSTAMLSMRAVWPAFVAKTSAEK